MLAKMLDQHVLGSKTTAQDYLNRLDIEAPPGVSLNAPPWLVESARAQIVESMSQPYWGDVNLVTRTALEVQLEAGITEGRSIDDIAKRINDRLGGEFPRVRGRLIARTEITDAMNAGHSRGMRELEEETGIPTGKEWVSVLGSTTRKSHERMDGVRTENSAAMFTLGGVQVPWPGHYKLPPQERCNCQCSVIGSFNMDAIEDIGAEVESEQADAKPKPKVPKAIPELKELEFVDRLGGSTGAGKYKDKDGNFYVVKRGSSEPHLREEFIAEELYRAAGVRIPESRLTKDADGKATKISRWVDGKPVKDLPWHTGPQAGTAPDQKKTFAKMRKDFGTDALFANWDVAGLDLDNVIVDAKGAPWRIDTGGSLRFRAQGSPKGEMFTDNVQELWSLRDKAMNPNTAKIYSMRHKTVVSSAKKTVGKKKAILKRLEQLEKDGIASPELRAKLEKRLNSMEEFVETSQTLSGDKWKEDYVDKFTRHEMDMRQAGVFDKFPEHMRSREPLSESSRNRDYMMEDQDGKEFDHLRGEDSAVSKFDGYLRTKGIKHKDIESYAEAQAGSSWSDESQTFKMHIALSRDKEIRSSYYWGGADAEVEASLLKGRKAAEKEFEKRLKHIDKWSGKPSYANDPEKYKEAMIAQHAYTYNFLKKTRLARSDQTRRVISLGRTESSDVINRYGMTLPGDHAVLTRGISESFGYTNTYSLMGNELTYQEMPFHRVFGSYLHTRTPGADHGMFMGDSENEFVCLAEGIEATYDSHVGSGDKLDPPEVWKKKRKRKR